MRAPPRDGSPGGRLAWKITDALPRVAPYPMLILLTSVLVAAAESALGTTALVKAQPLFVYVTYTMVMLVTVVWAFSPSVGAWSAPARWFLISILLTSLMALALSIPLGNLLYYSALATPLFVLLTLLRRPSPSTVSRAVDTFALALSVLLAVALLIDLVQYWRAGDVSGFREGLDSSHYLWNFPVDGLSSARWDGPLGHPNVTAPAGAFLLVLGITCRGPVRLLAMSSGLLTLLMTSSRTSQVAAVAGMFVLVLDATLSSGLTRRTRQLFLRITAGLVVVLGFAVVTYALVFADGVTGRTSIWSTYIELWWTSPLSGVGDPGIADAIREGVLAPAAGQGHNLVIDWITRYGLLGVTPLIAALLSAFVLGVQAFSRRQPRLMAVLTVVFVVGMTEASADWRYWGFGWGFALIFVYVGVLDADSTSLPTRPSKGPRRSPRGR